MKSEYLFTFASLSQRHDFFRGSFLKGHREPRIAWVGRSNVGKSSLINAVLGANLAQTSHQPGKTRAIHFYHWPKAKKILADLPGYGFAKAAKTERERWEKFISAYLENDAGLERAVVLLDSRHGPTELDLQAIEFLSLKNIPVSFVFTKVDTLKTQAQRSARRREISQIMSEVDPGSVFWVSVRQKTGIKALVQHLIHGPGQEKGKTGVNVEGLGRA